MGSSISSDGQKWKISSTTKLRFFIRRPKCDKVFKNMISDDKISGDEISDDKISGNPFTVAIFSRRFL